MSHGALAWPFGQVMHLVSSLVVTALLPNWNRSPVFGQDTRFALQSLTLPVGDQFPAVHWPTTGAQSTDTTSNERAVRTHTHTRDRAMVQAVLAVLIRSSSY